MRRDRIQKRLLSVGRGRRRRTLATRLALAFCLLMGGCATKTEDPSSEAKRSARGAPPGGGGAWTGAGAGRGGPPESDPRGVPVEVKPAERQPIALYFETQGPLEAENEVDLVARTAGPIVELVGEEGMQVRKGQLLARLDDRELRAQLEVGRVRLEEARLAFERVKSLHDSQLVSQEAFDQGLAAYQEAQGDFERTEIQLRYTEITAPFSGLIVERYVKFAEHLANGARLFRLSDFDPLLCLIQVPERELPRISKGQSAELQVEAWRGEVFAAKVLRISPVVDADTGTFRVTLEARGKGKLRPGMFATVRLEMERRDNALVIPKSALALDSLGDTVFVARDGLAERRTLGLGFRNDELLEVLSGLEDGEPVIVVGQEGLSEGTPIEILSGSGDRSIEGDSRAGAAGPPAGTRRGDRRPGGRPRLDPSDPQQVERIKARMRERGLSDEQIEQRLEQMRNRKGSG